MKGCVGCEDMGKQLVGGLMPKKRRRKIIKVISLIFVYINSAHHSAEEERTSKGRQIPWRVSPSLD
jgi:hypothetical protein